MFFIQLKGLLSFIVILPFSDFIKLFLFIISEVLKFNHMINRAKEVMSYDLAEYIEEKDHTKPNPFLNIFLNAFRNK